MSIIPSFFGDRKSNDYDPASLDVRDSFNGLYFPGTVTPVGCVNIDWKETPEAHIFTVDLPGLKKDEVKVEFEEGGILKISGERSKEQEEKNTLWHRIERGVGKFLRRFKLPENAETERTKANMENGVLTMIVPKSEKKKPDVRVVEILG